MFSIAWGARESSRGVRQLHLDSLPRFPSQLVDQGASGEVAPPKSSSARPASHRGRNSPRQRDREPRTRTPSSAPSGPRREAAVEVPEVTISDDGEDEEEQLRPHQRRRTTPCRPSPTTEVGTPESPSPTSSRNMFVEREPSLEIREEDPVLTNEAKNEVPLENSGPSWLRLGFEMPTEEEALRSLAAEIQEATPPLHNIRFTNGYAASYIGGPFWIEQQTSSPSRLWVRWAWTKPPTVLEH